MQVLLPSYKSNIAEKTYKYKTECNYILFFFFIRSDGDFITKQKAITTIVTKVHLL